MQKTYMGENMGLQLIEVLLLGVLGTVSLVGTLQKGSPSRTGSACLSACVVECAGKCSMQAEKPASEDKSDHAGTGGVE